MDDTYINYIEMQREEGNCKAGAPLMNVNAFRRWQNMLRGEEILKINGQLHRPTDAPSRHRSAIGVLCEAYWAEVGGRFRRDGSFVDIYDNHSRTGAPDHVLKWAGLEEKGPGIKLEPHSESLTIVALNDGLGCKIQSFDFIADAICLYL